MNSKCPIHGHGPIEGGVHVAIGVTGGPRCTCNRVKLWAVRTGNEDRFLGQFDSLEAAAAHVEKLEFDRYFPEGWEAVAYTPDGERYVYIDDWVKQ
jgi:hypothetical protein